jgi:hypothetical protein
MLIEAKLKNILRSALDSRFRGNDRSPCMSAPHLSPAETSLYVIVNAVRQLMQGRSNAAGSVTLASGATSTTVAAPNCAALSQVFLFPRTAHAAAELAAGGCYVSAVAAGTFTVSHANNPQADRTFGYACLG